MDVTGGARRVFVAALRKVDICEYPLYTTIQLARELVQNRHVVVFRLMERRGWNLDPPPISNRQKKDYHRDVLYNINNDHRRTLRQRVAPQANNVEEVKSTDGAVLPPRDEDKIAPEALGSPESRRPRG